MSSEQAPTKRKISDFFTSTKKAKTTEVAEETATDANAETSGEPSADEEKCPVISSYQDLDQLLPADWKAALDLDNKPYWKSIKDNLQARAEKKEQIFPPMNLTFNALQKCPLSNVRVVIIGQDPYHDDNQAMGLCFSVPRGVKVPSSLQNIYKELVADVPGFSKPAHGDLSSWAAQGVLMLNATLTVGAHKANSHKDVGWQKFTDSVVAALRQREHLVWVLWGAFAQKKAGAVNKKENCVLSSPHPSGLSAHRGFFGSKPFSQCNAYLEEHGQEPVDWNIPK